MLARANRVTKPEDFRRALSSGVKVVGERVAIHAALEPGSNPELPVRIGFIVGKACGSAVIRNQIKRRLKSISRSLLVELKPGTLVVVRALPSSRGSSFQALSEELTRNFASLTRKLERRSNHV
jgi:ribonuclease P protein component